jgi:hypothetical protein
MMDETRTCYECTAYDEGECLKADGVRRFFNNTIFKGTTAQDFLSGNEKARIHIYEADRLNGCPFYYER